MFKELLARTARQLDRRDIPYMVIGGQAVLLYGEPRLTRDIDITLGVGPEKAADIVGLAGELDLRILVEDPLEFAGSTFVLPCREEKTGIRLDFIFSRSSYEEQALRRTNVVRIQDVEVKFASLEDLIIHKVIAGRPRDLEDVKVVLARNQEFDRDYVLSWLREFDRALQTDFTGSFLELLRNQDAS
ncbi:nucleotidyl transferase AbiEii/AbiGii toxin family protein [Candidatus Solincola sp.]|nr:nucleotidyl transferase AbiEii/AbiGii toxin family protein [Actinomycetota bacterium]